MLPGLVLTNSHIFTEFKDIEESQNGLFFIDTAVMSALERLGKTTHIHIYIYIYTYIPLWHINQPSERFRLITY